MSKFSRTIILTDFSFVCNIFYVVPEIIFVFNEHDIANVNYEILLSHLVLNTSITSKLGDLKIQGKDKQY